MKLILGGEDLESTHHLFPTAVKGQETTLSYTRMEISTFNVILNMT